MSETRSRNAVAAGNNALITGAAAGIGAAFAKRCISEGINTLLVDVNEQALNATAESLRSVGSARVETRKVDVADSLQMENLVAEVEREFGSVHLLFNNAGVIVDGCCWERSEQDWRWIFDVNVFGVINGLRAFVPHMLSHGEPAHIINTASQAGLVASPFLGPYTATKHAVVGISETLYHELKLEDAAIGVSVICPGAVRDTALWESEQVRPPHYGKMVAPGGVGEKYFRDTLQQMMAAGMTPDELVERVFVGIGQNRFWLMTDETFKAPLKKRYEAQTTGSNPVLPMEN